MNNFFQTLLVPFLKKPPNLSTALLAFIVPDVFNCDFSRLGLSDRMDVVLAEKSSAKLWTDVVHSYREKRSTDSEQDDEIYTEVMSNPRDRPRTGGKNGSVFLGWDNDDDLTERSEASS